jgi:hypothetical protein
LRVVGVEFNGFDVNVRFTSVAGKTYRVERSSALAFGQWNTVVDNLPGINGVLQVTDFGVATLSPVFYRVRLLP